MKIKYVVMDVDGTLTDGKLYIGNEGELFKAFHVRDGYGIHDLLIPMGITPVVITGRVSEIVSNRCRELGITEVWQGVSDKSEQLKQITENLSAVAYIGDDLNDIPCMQLIRKAGGLVGCPADGAPQVLKEADFISRYNGGSGAVREFIEWILQNESHQQGR
ncbi:MAG: 3-deoxy-D-manno-octulosonate 8-phosphate phosphatase [Lachnospiraceae bacterium]|nr:3-deoxy-D-manno-octulosonate 8-phosphate phosphatase [Lachnospiraceae bacterium]